MPHRLKPWIVLIVIAGSGGCSADSSPTPTSTASGEKGSSNADADSSAAAAPQLTLTVYVDLDSTEMQTFQNPDAASVEKQIRSLDWSNPQKRPIVHLRRIAGDAATSIKLQGSQGSPNTDGVFRAIGTYIGGPNWVGESPPLESVDTGVALMQKFLNDPAQLKADVGTWKTE